MAGDGNLAYAVAPFLDPTCVQLRLVCPVGVSPARVIGQSPVAWMAGVRETDHLKPIDKAIIWMVSGLR